MIMKYQSFECFGVEYSKDEKLEGTSYFHTLNQALEFYKKMKWTYACKIITANQWGIKIDELM